MKSSASRGWGALLLYRGTAPPYSFLPYTTSRSCLKTIPLALSADFSPSCFDVYRPNTFRPGRTRGSGKRKEEREGSEEKKKEKNTGGNETMVGDNEKR